MRTNHRRYAERFAQATAGAATAPPRAESPDTPPASLVAP